MTISVKFKGWFYLRSKFNSVDKWRTIWLAPKASSARLNRQWPMLEPVPKFKMKQLFSFFTTLIVFVVTISSAFADCRGCCSGHGGTVCVNGITLCKDGTHMSDKCQTKCDKCEMSSTNFIPSIQSNSWNDSFSKAKNILKTKIYADHKITFYCDCPFDDSNKVNLCGQYTSKKAGKRAERIEWEHIVPAAHFGQSFKEWQEGHPDCVDKKGKLYKGRGCAGKISKDYRYMESDLYNLVSAIGEVNGLRSNYRFDMIAGEKRDFGACDMEIDSSARIAEPPEKVRGDIARTYKYMDQAYPGHGVIAGASKKLFDAWDKLDPVDSWECERVKRIEKIQGNENLVVKSACQKVGLW
jgi:deoxyribonuclease-1